MPRESKPYYRKAQKRWVATIRGKRITLGKTKAEALACFHKLMAESEPVATESFNVYQLSQKYLDWCEANRSAGTYRLHLHYLKSFVAHAGKSKKPSSLKPSMLTAWTDGSTWSTTSRNDAIGVVQRMLNWAVEREYLGRNPIAGMKKPRRRQRDTAYTPEQLAMIRGHAEGSFRDLLEFLFVTGCRPKEARCLEARHVHGDTVIFPADEAKGDQTRVIYLVASTAEIVHRLAKANPTGPIFLNSRGRPWTKDAIKCRLNRISKKVGFRVIAYGARHSFATNALMNSVDPISVAHLMGHKSPSMVAEVYSHLAQNPEFLRQQAIKSVASATGKTA